MAIESYLLGVEKVNMDTKDTAHSDMMNDGLTPDAISLNRVLLVEDNLLAQKATKFILEKFDCNIDVASSGEEALSQATQEKYDLIFMDIGLPDKDGFEVTTEIRAWENLNNKERTPIFALTAHADLDHKRHCTKVGMDEVLTKPLLQEHKQAILERYSDLKKSSSLTSDQVLPNIDWTQADKLSGGNREHAKQLLAATVAELPEEKDKIIQAYQDNDMACFADVVHRLHGVLCYVGTPALKSAIFTIEIALNKKEDIESHYHKLIMTIDNLINEHKNNHG